MIRIPPFNPADLQPIRKLYRQGKFPSKMKLQKILKECSARRFPSVKIYNEWCTTEGAIRAWVWEHSTPAFKKITS